MAGHSLVVYDVPTTVRVDGLIRAKLRKVGLRVNLSAWTVPTALLSGLELDKWRGWGVSCRCFAFSESEDSAIVEFAKTQLAKELGEIIERLDGYLANARGHLERAEATQSVDGLKVGEDRRRHGLRKARGLLADAESAAVAFGILGDVQGLIDSVRDATNAREAAWEATVREMEDARGDLPAAPPSAPNTRETLAPEQAVTRS